MALELGKVMCPSSEEKWATVVECKTRIELLEKTVEEIKETQDEQKKEKVDTQRYISNRRLALYLGIMTVVATFLGGFVAWLLQRVFP